MRTETQSSTTEAAIWARVIHPDGEISPEAARAIMELEFPESNQQRMHALALKAQEGDLTSEEEAEIDNFERVGTMLAILKSKSRKILKQTSRRHV